MKVTMSIVGQPRVTVTMFNNEEDDAQVCDSVCQTFDQLEENGKLDDLSQEDADRMYNMRHFYKAKRRLIADGGLVGENAVRVFPIS